MQTLNLSPESNSSVIPKERRTKDVDLIDLFPQPRYFQVHFQHIHENVYLLQNELTQLKDQVAQVDDKLGRLLALLSAQPDPVSCENNRT